MAKKGLGKGLNSLFNEEDIAEVFFDDELVYDGVKYPKDWE